MSIVVLAAITPALALQNAVMDEVLIKEKSFCAANYMPSKQVYLPSKVFEHIVEKYGANNTLTIYSMINLLHNSIASEERKTDVNCSVWQAFIQNRYKENSLLDENDFRLICPAMLKVAAEPNMQTHKEDTTSSDSPRAEKVWGFGLLSVTIISLCSLVGIGILPMVNRSFYNKVLLYLIALAVGTLSSNAVFQLIPEGFGVDGNPIMVWRSAVVFGGFYMFYVFENVLEKLFKVNHSHEITEDSLKFDCSVGPNTNSSLPSCENAVSLSSPSEPSSSRSEVHLLTPAGHELSKPVVSESLSKTEMSDSQSFFRNLKSLKKIKTLAWMITIADGMHNFIDGLAIGASFSSSLVQGVSTSIAIFCEEFPHELGDFAILLSSGMTVRQAAFFNFASACCCYLGFFVGVLVGHSLSSARWIFSIAGGVFLYISLAVMLPEAQLQASCGDLKKTPWKAFIIQNLGLLTGFCAILFLTLYQDEITHAV